MNSTLNSKLNNLSKKEVWSFCAKLILFVIWFLINLALAANHEQFGDEAQGWLLVKYNSLQGLIKCMWEEGHPWLYHLILFPFAKLGLSYDYVPYISLVGSAIMYAIILLKSKWNIKITALVLFLPPFLYYYTVYSRSYFLYSGLLLLIACFWKERKDKPVLMGILLGLLASTHLVGTLCAGIIMVLLYTEYFAGEITKKTIIALACNIGIMTVFLAPIFPTFTQKLEDMHLPTALFYIALVMLVAVVLIYLTLVHSNQKWNAFVNNAKTQKAAYISAEILLPVCSYVFLIVVYALPGITTGVTPQKLMVFVPALITGMIIKKDSVGTFEKLCAKKQKIFIGIEKVVILAAIAMWCVFGNGGDMIPWMFVDLTDNNSCSKQVAEWIDENIPENAYIVTTHRFSAMSVSAYLKTPRITDIAYDETITFIPWFTKQDCDFGFTQKCIEKLDEYGEVYVIMSLTESDYKDIPKERVFVKALPKTGEVVYKDEYALIVWEQYEIVKLTKGDLDGWKK